MPISKSEGTRALGRATVDWHHVWNRNPGNPLGGFALYCPRNPQDEDDTILRIWTEENLPHPRVAGPWTLETARDYLARWTRQHSDPSRFWIQASTPEELYEAVPYAEAAQVRDIYLFTDTWRGEPSGHRKSRIGTSTARSSPVANRTCALSRIISGSAA